MILSRFDSERDNAPKMWDVTWDELAAELLKNTVRAEKSGPAWSPAEFKKNTLRASANVVAIHVAVFDLDHITEEAVIGLVDRLEGMEYVLHSTHSHKPPDDCCLRLVMSLSRSVTPAEWGRLRPTLIKKYEIPADDKAKDPARLYYKPSSIPGTERVGVHKRKS